VVPGAPHGAGPSKCACRQRFASVTSTARPRLAPPRWPGATTLPLPLHRDLLRGRRSGLRRSRSPTAAAAIAWGAPVASRAKDVLCPRDCRPSGAVLADQGLFARPGVLRCRPTQTDREVAAAAAIARGTAYSGRPAEAAPRRPRRCLGPLDRGRDPSTARALATDRGFRTPGTREAALLGDTATKRGPGRSLYTVGSRGFLHPDVHRTVTRLRDPAA
jgi:hypothetical protein